MCAKTRKLGDEVEFWAHLAGKFSEVMTPEDKRKFNNLFESDFKSFVEEYLQRLINEINAGSVDTDLTLKQGDKFQAILDCEYVDEAIRTKLNDLIYGGDEKA